VSILIFSSIFIFENKVGIKKEFIALRIAV